MKTSFRILSMSLVALVAFTFASKTFAVSMPFQKITWTNSEGKVTEVTVDENGNFATPPMPTGKYTYSWSLVSRPTGSSARLNSDGSAMPSSTDGAAATSTTETSRRGISSAMGGTADRESSAPSVSEITVSYTIQSPRDIGSGQASGKQRMHKPISFSKRVDKSSPMLYTKLGVADVDTDGVVITGTVTPKNANGVIVRGWDIKTAK